MTEVKKDYAVLIGSVQKFPGKEVVSERPYNGGTLRSFTVRAAGSGQYVGVTLWDRHAHVKITENSLIQADGSYTTEKKNYNGQEKTFTNFSVNKISVTELDPGTPQGESALKKAKAEKVPF